MRRSGVSNRPIEKASDVSHRLMREQELSRVRDSHDERTRSRRKGAEEEEVVAVEERKRKMKRDDRPRPEGHRHRRNAS